MALVFFGPRKLPQISRSLGRTLAEFRKASEDFKRTWEREVALENVPDTTTTMASQEDSEHKQNLLDDSTSEAAVNEYSTEQTVARQPRTIATQTDYATTPANETRVETTAAEAPAKRDWL